MTNGESTESETIPKGRELRKLSTSAIMVDNSRKSTNVVPAKVEDKAFFVLEIKRSESELYQGALLAEKIQFKSQRSLLSFWIFVQFNDERILRSSLLALVKVRPLSDSKVSIFPLREMSCRSMHMKVSVVRSSQTRNSTQRDMAQDQIRPHTLRGVVAGSGSLLPFLAVVLTSKGPKKSRLTCLKATGLSARKAGNGLMRTSGRIDGGWHVQP